MRTPSVLSLATLALCMLAACSQTEPIVVPLSEIATVEDTYTLIWNGSSAAYRFANEHWVRDSTYDYRFSVVQQRYANKWRSIKDLHRMHPGYDGKAGDRDQTMYFAMDYQLQDKGLSLDLYSSLGNGTGRSDREFREQTIEFAMEGISRSAPYDHIRIEQHYKYEEGLLEETVLLFKKDGNAEVPFMKNIEKAYIYTRGKLDGPPTSFVP